MSHLLDVDVHYRRPPWQNHQTTAPPSPTTTTTTTAESPSSIQYFDDHTFSHHNYSTAEFQKEGDKRNPNNNDDDSEEFANILSLKLRKPNHWKWELSTSKSCSNIALPRILLYDHKGELLVDAQNINDSVYRQDDYKKSKRDRSTKRVHQSNQQHTEYQQRCATANLTHSIRKALENEFNGLQIQEVTPSPEPHSPTSNNSHCSRKAIDLNTTELPDYGLSRRSSSLKGVRFHVENDYEDTNYYRSQIPEFLPTPPSTTTPTSSSSGPREKRKYRRSQSSVRSLARSESILERFSYQRGRFSSPEYAEEKEVQHSPCYFLRTCRAGTLLVQEDSFRQHPRRRKRSLKNRSTESLQSSQKSLSLAGQQQQHAYNSLTRNKMSISSKKQQHHKRRHLTDVNKQSSISEEDDAVTAFDQKQLTNNVNLGNLHKYAPAHNQAKELDYTVDMHQNGKVR